MATILIGALLVAFLCLAARHLFRSLRSGCCGTGKTMKKIHSADKVAAHYPYVKVLKIEGMTCRNCVIRIANALNSLEGVFAKVTLGKAVVRMKLNLPDDRLQQAVAKEGYTVLAIENGRNSSMTSAFSEHEKRTAGIQR